MRKCIMAFCFCVAVLGMISAAGSMAAEEKKITGTIIDSDPDPTGKMAPVKLQCDDCVYLVIQNAISKRMENAIGSQADITGLVDEQGGRKVITPWLFERRGGKPRVQPTT